jgi:SsrA-binding protein
MSGQDVQIQNHKAGRDYHVIDTLEAGIELKGTEVKSLRGGQGNLSDSFARVEQGQAFLYNFHISPYDKGNRENHDPKRVRRLLLHKHEILKLLGLVSTEGKTLIPLKAYFDQNSRFKILLGICKGKTHGDKRQDLKKRDTDREIRRAMTARMKRG